MMNFLGGLLDNPGRAVGIDPEQIDPSQRTAYRGMVLSALGNQIAGGTPFYQSLGSIRQGMDEREAHEMQMQAQRAQMEAQEQINAELSGAMGGQGGQPGQAGPGGQGSPAQLKAQALRRAAMRIAAVNPDVAKKYIDMADAIDPRPEFFAPMAVTGPDGQPMLAQFGKHGTQRAIDGFTPPAPDLPADVRALEYVSGQSLANTGRAGVDALGGYRRAGAPSQNVNMGDTHFGPTSTDRMRIADPTAEGGYRIIDLPGGQAYVEAQQRAEAERFKQQNLERAGGTVVQDIGRALNIVRQGGPFATGRGAFFGLFDPVSQASQIEDLVGSVRGNIGVDQLQQMRNASPTGGAIGNVTERQLEGLQGLLGSLKVTGSREILEDNLKRISNLYMDTIHGTPEQIRVIGAERGLTPEQIEILSQRYELSFDELGRPVKNRPQAPQEKRPTLREIFGGQR